MPVSTALEGTIAVAMSGGLDSSVVAWLLAQEDRRRVVGLSMLLWDRSHEAKSGRCCGALDLADAQRVSSQIGIPHYTLKMDKEFRQTVVDPFVNDYLAGRTPSPCIRCNTWVKFDLFVERARALGAEKMATGHYARIVEGADGYELHTALDPDKDQSYYLFELTQQQLAFAEFPLGGMSKPAVREMARQAELVVAEKGESMEVCFVAGGVQEFVEEEVSSGRTKAPRDAHARPARVVDESGKLLGESSPYYRYTVGQRRGLGVSGNRPLYVLQIDPDENQVVVGDSAGLLKGGLVAEREHWIGIPPEREIEATVRIRSRHAGVRSTIRRLGEGRVEVQFSEPQSGISPGQAAVFYDGSRILGGSWIEGALD